MTAPFRGSGPWRGRGPFLGRGPWAGKAPFGFNAGLPFQINVTGAQLRAALATPSAWGTTGASTGWLLPGLGGARLSGDCRTSVAMQTEADGTVGYAAHNLLLNSATMATQTVTVVSGATYTLSAYGTGSIATSGAAVATLTGTGADNRVSVTVTATDTSLVMTLTGAMDRAQLNLGSVALAYVPTTAAARFGPAIDWLTAQSAYGIRSESARTNLVLYSRDLTNAAYTKTNATAALTATGVDGVANTASTLTATAANGTALQAITSASAARALSVYLRRKTGTGTVETTIDGGTTWVPRTLTSSWARFDTLATVTDPSVGVRIVTSGDEVDVDIVQCESGTEASSPIITLAAAATRAADTLDVVGSGINATRGTLIVDAVLIKALSAGTILAGLSATGFTILYCTNTDFRQYGSNDSFLPIPNSAPVLNTVQRAALAWDAGSYSVSAKGLLATNAAVIGIVNALRLGDYASISSSQAMGGHFTRIRYSLRRANDGTLRGLTV